MLGCRDFFGVVLGNVGLLLRSLGTKRHELGYADLAHVHVFGCITLGTRSLVELISSGALSFQVAFMGAGSYKLSPILRTRVSIRVSRSTG